MHPLPDEAYTYTAQQVGDLLGIRPATVRKHAQLQAEQGHALGRVFTKPGGGWVRRYSEADVAYLRSKSTGTRGWPKGKSRKAAR